jgi:hypothetical protein
MLTFIEGTHRPRTATEGEGADRGKRDARRIRDQRLLAPESMERVMAAVARQEPACDDNETRADHRQPDDQVPGRGRLTKAVRQIVPQPVLEIVYEGEKDRREQRSRDADHRAQDDEAEVPPRAQLRLGVPPHLINSMTDGRTAAGNGAAACGPQSRVPTLGR